MRPLFLNLLKIAVLAVIGCLVVFHVAFVSPDVIAQVPPDRRFLFDEDSSKRQDEKVERRRESLTRVAPSSKDLDVKAPSLEFLKEKNEVKGTGGSIISSGGVIVQADDATVNLSTKDTTLQGNVLVSGIGGSIAADSGTFNVESETGQFEKAEIEYDLEGYRGTARSLMKMSEFEYEMSKGTMSTCGCPNGESPWVISASSTHVTQEGFAHCYNATIDVAGVPVLYTPYIAFPVKTERQSGLLVPTFGYSSQDGLQLSLPLFGVIGDSSDFTFTPFLETHTRAGAGLEFREVFSRRSKLDAKVVYSDERARDGSLRGTITSDLFDPTIDEDRVGGYLRQNWSNEPDSFIPLSMVSDVHLASDDLMVREIDEPGIGEYNSRYLTSRVVGRAGLGPVGLAEISTEYNQSLLTDDDIVLQRLPDFSLTSLQSFRPFGFNPYGLKVTGKNIVQVTNFSRDEGYDGWRTSLVPKVAIPFHVKNYVNAEASASLYYSSYSLDETVDPFTGVALESSSERSVPVFNWKMSTGVERIFDLDEGNWLSTMLSRGVRGQDRELTRLKHTIEPTIGYTYIPEVDQDDLPLFDSSDRIRERSLFSLGFRTALLGKFEPRGEGRNEIDELTPNIEDLPSMIPTKPLPEFGEGSELFPESEFSVLRKGEVVELASLTLKETFDYNEYRDDTDPLQDPWSDLYIGIGLNPSHYVQFKLESNLDLEEVDASSWAIGTQLLDDRGDALRARFSYIENSLSQIEGNLEVKLAEQLRFGYYARYDELEREFIESRVGLRLISGCRCWHADLGFSDRLNPDRQEVLLSVTLSGLGDLAQAVTVGKQKQ